MHCICARLIVVRICGQLAGQNLLIPLNGGGQTAGLLAGVGRLLPLLLLPLELGRGPARGLGAGTGNDNLPSTGGIDGYILNTSTSEGN